MCDDEPRKGAKPNPHVVRLWGDKVLINVAEHRKKTQWIRDNPQVSILIIIRTCTTG